MAYITDAQLGDMVAVALQKAGRGDLVANMTNVGLTNANETAYRTIVDALIARGYTQAEIDAWPSRTVYNRMLGTYWALVFCAGIKQSDTWVEKYNWEERLDEVQLTGADGKPVNDNVQGGDLDTSTDLVVLEDGTGQVTKW